ncbi:MAG: hypothetical protein K8W52_23430 [Deltaproteobacteria bacterium]|nr:hypothetical protein [Deltaproteobacteria bacterium]
MRHLLVRSLALAFLAGGCVPTHYVYAPEHARGWSDGYPTTWVDIPPGAPAGTVAVTSFGITELTPDTAGPVTALHVRLAIANDGDTAPWTAITSDQLIEIAGEGRSRPILVNTDATALPDVTIAPRERRVLDLYYPLPADLRDEDALAGFDVLWQVTTPARPVAGRVHFARVTVEEPAHGDVVLWTGWGPTWWYEPAYPGLVFHHHHPIVIRHPRPHVIVTHPPIRHVRAIRDHRH